MHNTAGGGRVLCIIRNCIVLYLLFAVLSASRPRPPWQHLTCMPPAPVTAAAPARCAPSTAVPAAAVHAHLLPTAGLCLPCTFTGRQLLDICERINSEFAFIADRRRNRLAHARANKLVSCFHNLRLLKRMTKTNYTEPAVGWTEEDTTSGITKYGIVNYEYYNESVDVLSYVCEYTHVLGT